MTNAKSIESGKNPQIKNGDPGTLISSSPLVGIVAGLLACIGIFAIDMGVLELARYYDWKGISVYPVYAVFILQTALLGWVAGIKINQQPIWWVFFCWMLLLVNLVLILVKLNSYSWDRTYQSAFVFAFLTAQIGLVLFWGILGTSDWRRRIPIAVSWLAVASYPYWFGFMSVRDWLSVTTCYIISVAVACICLRLWRFRLGTREHWDATTIAGGRMDQFGIKHLFIWTTIVAVLFGIGRLVPWTYIAAAIADNGVIALFLRALLMTVIVVATAWAVLGDKPGTVVRGIVFVGVLILIGLGLSVVEIQQLRLRRWSSLIGWRMTNEEVRKTWLIWTTLNGLFLAGLMLVVRMSGVRLARVKRIKADS